MRFAGATIETAIRGLESEFSGIGEDLDATVAPDASKEWIISDRGYKLQYHTFVSSDMITKPHILTKERKKVAFLRRKFLEDLSESRKIFVCVDRFKQPMSAALPPFLALNRNGKHPMLWVSESVDGKVGYVREVLPGLYAARIDRLSSHGQPQSASLELWLSILVNAWLLAKKHGHIVVSEFQLSASPSALEDEGREAHR